MVKIETYQEADFLLSAIVMYIQTFKNRKERISKDKRMSSHTQHNEMLRMDEKIKTLDLIRAKFSNAEFTE